VGIEKKIFENIAYWPHEISNAKTSFTHQNLKTFQRAQKQYFQSIFFQDLYLYICMGYIKCFFGKRFFFERVTLKYMAKYFKK